MQNAHNAHGLDAILVAKVAFIRRWNAARTHKLAAYSAADERFRSAVRAGEAHNATTNTHDLAVSTADLAEAVEMDAAGTEYEAVRSAASRSARPLTAPRAG